MCYVEVTAWRCHHTTKTVMRCPHPGTDKCKRKEYKMHRRLLCKSCTGGSKTVEILDAMLGPLIEPLPKPREKKKVETVVKRSEPSSSHRDRDRNRSRERTYERNGEYKRNPSPVRARKPAEDRRGREHRHEEHSTVCDKGYDHAAGKYVKENKGEETNKSSRQTYAAEEHQQQYVGQPYHGGTGRRQNLPPPPPPEMTQAYQGQDQDQYYHQDDRRYQGVSARDRGPALPRKTQTYQDEGVPQRQGSRRYHEASARAKTPPPQAEQTHQNKSDLYQQGSQRRYQPSAQNQDPSPQIAQIQQQFQDFSIKDPHNDGQPVQQSRVRSHVSGAGTNRMVNGVSINAQKPIDTTIGKFNTHSRVRYSEHSEAGGNVTNNRTNSHRPMSAAPANQGRRNAMAPEVSIPPQPLPSARQATDSVRNDRRHTTTPDSNSETLVDQPATAQRYRQTYIQLDPDSDDDNHASANAPIPSRRDNTNPVVARNSHAQHQRHSKRHHH